MKPIFIILLLAGFIFAAEPVDYINPNIGGISHLLVPTYNTVHLPNSMVRFNPIKSPGISDHYVAGKIYGFPINFPGHRQKHILTLMATSGQLDVRPARLASDYDHDFETITPYYYSVLLEDENILAEFTPSSRSAIYRFSLPAEAPAHIVIRGDDNVEAKIMNDSTLIASEVVNGARQFAFLEFSQKFSAHGCFLGSQVEENLAEIRGDECGIYITFAKPESTLEIAYGVSFVSYEQAHKNLEKEAGHLTFDSLKETGREIWNAALSQIQITGGSEDQKTVFYTAFYRTFERMVNISEDGRYYSAYDKQVHAETRPFYVDDWSWDTYRALHPLRVLLNPGMQADILQSYVRMYEQSGWMPTFPQVSGDMGGMIGHHQAAIFADAWFKGVRNFDINLAYEGLLHNALHGTMLPWREGPTTALDDFYRENGWFPALDPGAKDPVENVHPFEKRQAVAVTLEHAYDDWCLAQLAASLDHAEDMQMMIDRARNYKHVYNAETGFMAPKRQDGSWVNPFDPLKSHGPGCREYFAEVNAWTYTFHVQHDVEGLIRLMGGPGRFVERLNALFEKPMFGYCRWEQTAQIPDGTGMVGQFVMGNEQSFHIPYMYVYAGAPWRTQKRLRMLMDTWFRNDLMGICGDEDGGAMSAWYVFSALGFYPVTPGMPVYVIGTPLFEEATVQLPNGKTLVIKANNNSAQNKYIQSVTLNGKAWRRAWFTHGDIVNGGKFVFEMGPRPNKEWGALEPPPSMAVIK